jgi:hypothetical protein
MALQKETLNLSNPFDGHLDVEISFDPDKEPEWSKERRRLDEESDAAAAAAKAEPPER